MSAHVRLGKHCGVSEVLCVEILALFAFLVACVADHWHLEGLVAPLHTGEHLLEAVRQILELGAIRQFGL